MSNVWNSADTKIPFHTALYLDLLWQIFLSNHLLFMGCFFPPGWRWGRSEGLLFLVSHCVLLNSSASIKWSFYVQQFIMKTNRWNVKALFQVKVIWFFLNVGHVLFLANLWLFNVESYKPNIQASNVGSLWGATLLLFRHSKGFGGVFFTYTCILRLKGQRVLTLFYFCCLRIRFNVLYSATIVVWCWSYIFNLIQMSCKFDFFSYQDKVTFNFENHF